MFDSLKTTTSYLSFYCFWFLNRSQSMKFVSYESNRIRIFRCSCVKNFRESYVFHCLVIKVVCLATAYLLYHICFSLSSTFLSFFQSFSDSFDFSKRSPDVWLSALFKRLDYFNMFVLSCQALFLISFFFQKSYLIVSFKETIISDSSTNITPKDHNVNS